MLSLANVDLEQFGRGLLAFFMFVIPAFAALGIFGWAERKAKHIKWNKRRQQIKTMRQPIENDFFFGEIKDWSELK